MSVEELRQFLSYHYWALDRILDATGRLSEEDLLRDVGSSFKSVRDTLVHLYSAEWVWCSRWHGASPSATIPADTFVDVATLRHAWKEQETSVWAAFEEFARDDVDRAIEYRDLKGNPWRQSFAELVRHVVNHGTYHRGQITTMLRQLGATPPKSMDLITFYRERGQPGT